MSATPIGSLPRSSAPRARAPARAALIDSMRPVATPEGIELGLRLAGPVPRALAWLIDLAWRMGLMIVLMIPLASMGRLGVGLMLLSAFLLEWIVPAWLETRYDGATPGKRAMGLRVLRDDGAPIGFGAALARNLLRAADFLPLMYLGGLVCMLWQRDFKRLGDLVAGTIVVHVDAREQVHPVPVAEPIAPPVALTGMEKRALLDFAERVPRLSPERSAELAALAPRLTGGATGADAVRRLVGMANHLLGRRGEEGVRRAPG